MLKVKGLATGIGSLPFTDADAALDLIFKYVPYLPFWPQLPKRSHTEGMVAQFSENLPCLEFSADGLFFNPRDKDKQLEIFYDRIIAADLNHFRISPDFALGLHKFYQRLKKSDLSGTEFIKCHITGPFTFAAGINDENGRALLHEQVFMQAISKGLIMKALWQADLFKEFGKKIILFVDEPYLGAFGSAYTPLNRQDVVKTLKEFIGDIKSDNILTGVHCCGNTDWSIFTEVQGIDIINFDAFDFMDKFLLYAENLKNFLARGGIICWGIVPTQQFSGQETADFLIKRLKEGINVLIKKGIDEKLLFDNLMISPSCGLGTLAPQKAEKIFRLLADTSRALN